jgi:hypothetical protein
MKRFLIVSILFFAALLPAAAQFFTEKFKEVPSEPIPSSRQGAVALGDYLFHFYDKGKGIEIYSLKDGRDVQRMPMPGGRETWHSNNACVSGTYLDRNDKYPLVYVSQENAGEHCICVFRIIEAKKEKFSAELVQTIILPTPLEMGVWYPNLVLDNQKGEFYVSGYSRASWKDGTGGNALQYLKFIVPDVGQSEVILSTSDIIDRRLYPFRLATQGAVIRDGCMYQVYGIPPMGETSLVCYDLETGAVKWCRNLISAGIPGEPEALFFYGKELICVDVKGVVYSAAGWD